MPLPSSGRFAASLRSSAAVVLCALLPCQILPAQSAPAEKSPLSQPANPQDRRIIHLLSRFTFGPTPEEIAEIRELGPKGIDEWFDRQLHPDRLPMTADDRVLDARLAEFPALKLPVDQLVARFPSNGVIRQAAAGKLPVPDDPYLYAIYSRHIQEYKDKQAKKEQAQSKPAEMNPGAKNGSTKPETTSATESLAIDSGAQAPKKPVSAKSYVPDRNRPVYEDVLVQSVLHLPPSQRVRRILFMQPTEYEQFHSNLRPAQRLELMADLDPEQRELLADQENPTHTVVAELEAQRLFRDIYSSRQLQEVMTTFWLNHFNVYLHKSDETPYYLASYERDAIRPYALGNFEDILVATAESPAMLLYLDNSSSTGPDSKVAERQKEREAAGKAAQTTPPGLNENYARELMELHTLGVNGGYTQQDVTEVAKILTGWTVDHPQLGGDFIFEENRHEPGKKLVMGHKFKDDGQKEGLKLLHMLATSPATAHFISRELAIAFVSDNPPQALVDRMAASFQSHHGEIADVLRTLVRSPEFWAPEAYQAKVKTPLEYIISAIRASDAEVTNVQPLINWLNQMSMPLYGCVPPTGYSDKADAWVSTGELVTRMNFALSLANGKLTGVKPQWPQLSSAATDPPAAEQSLEAQLLPTGASEKTRTAVLNEVQPQRTAQPQSGAQTAPDTAAPNKPKTPAGTAGAQSGQSAQIAALLLGSPEFQRR